MESNKQLIQDLKRIIESSRNMIYRQVNTELLKMYMLIGQELSRTIEPKRGKPPSNSKTLSSVSKELTKSYGNGFSRQNLSFMIIFYKDYGNCQPLVSNLSWAHYTILLSIKNIEERKYYENACVLNTWSKRELTRQVKSCAYERSLLGDKLSTKFKNDNQSQKFLTKKFPLKEPIVLEFFKHREKFLEKDLEESILRHMKQFMLELGQGFLFMGNQYHLNIENKHYYVDLVLYNKILNSYVLIELKAKPVDHNAVGQINLYLNYFKEHINQKDDNDPIGIIMCTDKNNIEVEYALGGMSNQIFVSKYITHLPKKEDLEKELIKLIK